MIVAARVRGPGISRGPFHVRVLLEARGRELVNSDTKDRKRRTPSVGAGQAGLVACAELADAGRRVLLRCKSTARLQRPPERTETSARKDHPVRFAKKLAVDLQRAALDTLAGPEGGFPSAPGQFPGNPRTIDALRFVAWHV